MKTKKLLMASGFKDHNLKAGEYFYMINERLESALAWCKKNNLDPTRLKKFNRLTNRLTKKKRFKMKRRKLSDEKAKKRIQS